METYFMIQRKFKDYGQIRTLITQRKFILHYDGGMEGFSVFGLKDQPKYTPGIDCKIYLWYEKWIDQCILDLSETEVFIK